MIKEVKRMIEKLQRCMRRRGLCVRKRERGERDREIKRDGGEGERERLCFVTKSIWRHETAFF